MMSKTTLDSRIFRTTSFLFAIGLVVAMGCGRRDTNGPSQDDPSGNTTCTENSDCTGVGESCVGGACAVVDGDGTVTGDGNGGGGDSDIPATTCGRDSDCPSGAFCEFVVHSNRWNSSLEGTCRPLGCVEDNNCVASLGQRCFDGRCYTEADCTPGQGATDCPPDEVCDPQTYTCTAPPDSCYFAEECPTGWACIDRACVDTSSPPPDCTVAADCSDAPACSAGDCECVGGSCIPPGGCATHADCPTGEYCASGMCATAETCTVGDAGDPCGVWGLICTGGYCVDPDPCGPGNTCAPGLVCRTNYSPPVCLPEGGNECSRDDQCLGGEYCELFNGECMPGCRDDDACQNLCDDPSPPSWCNCIMDPATCYCGSSRTCSGTGGSGTGSDCDTNDDCAAGRVCAANDPGMSFLCPDPLGIVDCSQSCYESCDQLMAMVGMDSCTTGACTSLGGTGDLLVDALLALFGGGLGDPSASAGVCQ